MVTQFQASDSRPPNTTCGNYIVARHVCVFVLVRNFIINTFADVAIVNLCYNSQSVLQ